MVYHVTSKTNMLRILMEGFKPQIGPRSKVLGEKAKATYFFSSPTACDDGLMTWLDGSIRTPVVMIVDLPQDAVMDPSVAWEIKVLSSVPAIAVVGVVTADQFINRSSEATELLTSGLVPHGGK